MRHSKKKDRNQRPDVDWCGIISNFISVYHWQSFRPTADTHKIITTSLFFSPKNWKMLLQMLLFFGWPSCVPVCLCAHIRRPSPRSSSVAVVHLAPLSHIPASFLLVHWSFSLHHLALDFQPMCVRFFSCPSLFRRSISIEVVICVSWYGNMCNHELCLKCRITSRNISPCINHTIDIWSFEKVLDDWLTDPVSAVCLSIVMLLSYIPLWGYIQCLVSIHFPTRFKPKIFHSQSDEFISLLGSLIQWQVTRDSIYR